MSSLPVDYRSMTAAEILDALYVQIYEPPFSELREDLRSVPDVLRIPILLIDLDTEVTMGGMIGFLENSTGLYFVDTIEALEKICAHRTADILRAVQKIMSDHGVTAELLRAQGFAGLQLYQITSFRETHGPELAQMADLIDREARKLYLYDDAGEAVFDLLRVFLEPRKNELVAALEAC
jgi:uncharacterized protein DUF4375